MPYLNHFTQSNKGEGNAKRADQTGESTSGSNGDRRLDAYDETTSSHHQVSREKIMILDEKISKLIAVYGINAVRNSLDRMSGNDLASKYSLTERTLTAKKQRIITGIIDGSFDAMFAINKNGIILTVNKTAVKQFGWTEFEFLGKNISMIVGGDRAAHHDCYIRSYLKTGEKRVMGKKRELQARRKDGSEFPIELGLTEIRTEHEEDSVFCGFIRDLTSIKKNEREIERKKLINVGINDASFDAMFTINEMGTILTANKAAVSEFGWTENEFVGENICLIVGGGHAPNHDAYIKRYLKTGERRVMGKKRELQAKRKDGSEFPIELGLTEVRLEPGGEKMFCGFVRNLTVQKEHENEMKRKQTITMGIIEASFDAVFVIDSHGTIRFVNKAACEKFGWPKAEFIGQNLEMIMHSASESKHDDGINNFLRAGIKSMIGTQREVNAVRADGTSLPVMFGLSEVNNIGRSNLFVAFIRDLSHEKKLLEMEVEQKAAEALLLNVLPEDIVSRLKADPTHIADHYPLTTILFADIVGFTAMSSLMSPVELVKMLNDLFSRFDELVEQYDLNKVKTIGDCYMATSVPDAKQQPEECIRVCHFASDMIDAVRAFNREYKGQELNLRVGIHAGPVVAGVVGTKRFLYDLWGDSVNLASRMESTGVPGRIQVSKQIVDLVGASFEFESRGLVQVKGKGEVATFFIRKQNLEKNLPSRRMSSLKGMTFMESMRRIHGLGM